MLTQTYSYSLKTDVKIVGKCIPKIRLDVQYIWYIQKPLWPIERWQGTFVNYFLMSVHHLTNALKFR